MTIFELMCMVLMCFVLAILIFFRNEIKLAIVLYNEETKDEPLKGRKLFEHNESEIREWRKELKK